MQASRIVSTLSLLISFALGAYSQTKAVTLGTGDQPSLSTSPGGTLGITYGQGNDIYFSQSDDNGRTFSEPETVATLPGLVLGMSSGPQLSLSREFYTIMAPDRAGNLYAWRKKKSDPDWQGPYRVNDIEGASGESLGAMSYDNNGKLYAIWIDTRKARREHSKAEPDAAPEGHQSKERETGRKPERASKQPEKPEMSHDMPTPLTKEELMKEVGEMPEGAKGVSQYPGPDGKMYWVVLDAGGNALKAKDMESYKKFKAQNAGREKPQGKIFIAESSDGGKTWTKSKLVYASPDGSVCECCKPSLISEGNNLYIMFRNNMDGNRDLYLTQSVNGGAAFSKPEKLGQGNWEINGCPMDGGDLTFANGQILSVWQRQGQIYAASPGQREQLLGQGRSPALAITPEGNYYFWNLGGNILGKTPTSLMQMNLGQGSSFKVTSLPNDKGVLGVWVTGGQIHVRRIS
ncbi:MAG: hypothetical protein HEP71_25555 [Roseivirga sp.]|nr:hypothetical protein [Roseivirga sp.]